MSQDDLDRILSSEREIVPSSGFAGNVMDAIRREASAPPPIPFPWRRALPGMVISAAAVLALFVMVFSQLGRVAAAAASPASHRLVSIVAASAARLGWVVLALAVWFASVALSRHVAGTRT